MPYDRPTLSQLRQQAAGDMNAALPGADALLRFSNLGILADVLAGLTAGHYGYLDWIARNAVPFTATDEHLEGWAALRGITRKAATPAAGRARFSATNGAVVPSGTTVRRADGVGYTTTAEATAVDGIVVAAISADEPGAAGNALAATTMILGAGVSGVSVSGVAAEAITGGADIETDEDLRSRMLAAYASPARGGARGDYVDWALAVPGVTRAWVVPAGRGAGTVVVYFMLDVVNASSGGFPRGLSGCAAAETRDSSATGDQLAVADAIFPRQPVTALVYAVAPTSNDVQLTIAGLATSTIAVRNAITAAVKAAMAREGVPGGILRLSTIERAIAAVPGAEGFIITGITAAAGTIAPAGVGNITSAAGALPTLAGITYA